MREGQEGGTGGRRQMDKTEISSVPELLGDTLLQYHIMSSVMYATGQKVWF